MIRTEEIRIRVTSDEKKLIKTFIKNGKEEKLWVNNRTMLKTLMEYWNNTHIKGKFINNRQP